MICWLGETASTNVSIYALTLSLSASCSGCSFSKAVVSLALLDIISNCCCVYYEEEGEDYNCDEE